MLDARCYSLQEKEPIAHPLGAQASLPASSFVRSAAPLLAELLAGRDACAPSG